MEVLWCSRRLVAFELELSTRCCERILVAVGLELENIFLPKEALFEEEIEGSVAPVLTKESKEEEIFFERLDVEFEFRDMAATQID